DRCRRGGCNPFATPGKAEPLAGRCLDAYALDADPGQVGDVGAHAVAVLSDARGFAHDREVEMRDAAAARSYALNGESEKTIGRGTSPLRVAGRKVRANISVGKGAEDRIGERMKRDIGVGVTGERVAVRNADSTKGDVVARAKRVDVQTRSSPHVTKGGRLDRFRAREVRRRCEFDVARLT